LLKENGLFIINFRKEKNNSKADITDLEKNINEMVYKLYELTGEEIGIIEA
jgi:hypothetical protein